MTHSSTTKQHKNATTTPEVRAFIRESELPTAVLARLLKISESTVRKWRQRDTLEDLPHTPKKLNTTLSLQEQYVVVQLRTHLMLSLDQLLKVCRQFINENTSRAGLQRCLKRHGVSKLADIDPEGELTELEHQVSVAIKDKTSEKVQTSVVNPQAMIEVLNQLRVEEAQASKNSVFADHTKMAKSRTLTCDDVVQVTVTTLPELTKKSDKKQNPYRLLIANDPDSTWVYVDLYQDEEVDAARRYMKHVLKHAPFPIRRLLAENYNEFLSRFRLLNEQ